MMLLLCISFSVSTFALKAVSPSSLSASISGEQHELQLFLRHRPAVTGAWSKHAIEHVTVLEPIYNDYMKVLDPIYTHSSLRSRAVHANPNITDVNEGVNDVLGGVADILGVKKNAAQLAGVKTNQRGDLKSFVVSLATNSFMILCTLGIFMYLRRKYPLVYQNNVLENKCPPVSVDAESRFAWLLQSFGCSVDDVAQHTSLDSALLLEFTHMGMRVFGIIALPMFCIMGPMNAYFGGNADGGNNMDFLSMNNVQIGSWLYWIYCPIVWGVVIFVIQALFHAKWKFVVLRSAWLKRMKHPRATTVMVEGIPEEYRSDEYLKQFFNEMFAKIDGADRSVKEAFVVKKLPELQAALVRRDELEQEYTSVNFQIQEQLKIEAPTEDDQKLLADLEKRAKALPGEIKAQKEEVSTETKLAKQEITKLGGVNTGIGFVTFNNRIAHEIALNANFDYNATRWRVSLPPAPATILWDNLTVMEDVVNVGLPYLAYFLLALLTILYLPLVYFISDMAEQINVGWFEPLWEAFAPSIGLSVVTSFLPTICMSIASSCYTMVGTNYLQLRVQKWYFLFGVLYVILVVAIGAGIETFIAKLADHPLIIFNILADTMPSSSNFYETYIMLQWFSQCLLITRYTNLVKFLFYSRRHAAENARKFAEPEAQDSSGLGARSATLALNFCIGLVFCTLTPTLNIIIVIFFLFGRLIYGYLLVFAETRKPDLGGVAFLLQLEQIFLGLLIYCIFMVGLLFHKASSPWVGGLTCPVLIFLWIQYYRFNKNFEWEKMSWEDVVASTAEEGKMQYLESDTYVQPEIKEIMTYAAEDVVKDDALPVA